MYRRLLLALSLLACTASSPAQLRADEAVYELRAPGEANATARDRASHNVGSQHGDQTRPALSTDVLAVPASIPSTVRPSTLLVPTGGTGIIPPSSAPDNVGAFRFICMPGQISYDDPIVYPNQPGRSHLHQWYGNTAANAASTYASLRTSGDSTCMNVLNRSAYWMPAMLDGKGHVVRPDYVTIYYKRFPAISPECRKIAARGCTDLPRGLRMIFGYDMITHQANRNAAYFNCDGPGATPGHYATITEAAKNCPAGARLGAVIAAPNCWDGTRLDSPNHRDHLAFGSYGQTGVLRCPSTHPYVIPSFTLGAWYSVDEARADSWYLSSDEMPGMERMPAGSTFHADWFGAWDDQVMTAWTENCINKMLNCSTGELGDGRQMKQVGEFAWKTPRRLVPIPPRPAATAP
ncbi:hypothetical protein J2Y58_001837 [Sphingomonas sp. BE138]|uniref:DUF1996 domain-containing protein n=1 Tax=Sphingomonas sp. BE138 TaxID=2817845 RepID=UPI00285F6BE6|nr:DUF1996 domain-containing protein [Sphingomonas sp. BE138]MDR6788479.1 hypothetical protein [Sphingomonas sp. BE138]